MCIHHWCCCCRCSRSCIANKIFLSKNTTCFCVCLLRWRRRGRGGQYARQWEHASDCFSSRSYPQNLPDLPTAARPPIMLLVMMTNTNTNSNTNTNWCACTQNLAVTTDTKTNTNTRTSPQNLTTPYRPPSCCLSYWFTDTNTNTNTKAGKPPVKVQVMSMTVATADYESVDQTKVLQK